MLHTLAETYSLLPSQVYAQADTFDLWVYDVATKQRNKQYQKERAKLKINSNTPTAPKDYDLVSLEEMFNRVKNKQK